MSTKKFLAKRVFEGPTKNYRNHFLLENGVKVVYCYGYKPEDYEGAEFVIIKKLPVSKSEEYRYEVYKIPKHQTIRKYPSGYMGLTWFGKSRDLGYVIEGEL